MGCCEDSRRLSVQKRPQPRLESLLHFPWGWGGAGILRDRPLDAQQQVAAGLPPGAGFAPACVGLPHQSLTPQREQAEQASPEGR